MPTSETSLNVLAMRAEIDGFFKTASNEEIEALYRESEPYADIDFDLPLLPLASLSSDFKFLLPNTPAGLPALELQSGGVQELIFNAVGDASVTPLVTREPQFALGEELLAASFQSQLSAFPAIACLVENTQPQDPFRTGDPAQTNDLALAA